MKVGVLTMPTSRVTATSGFRKGLPPTAPWHWLVGQFRPELNTEPAGTPVATQSAAVVGVVLAAEHGSRPAFDEVPPAGVNSSATFGARTARSNEARKA